MYVLIIKTSSMGDILHTLPALTDAMQALPNIYFDWVVEENFTQIPTWHPAVCQVLPIAIRRWRKNWFNKTTRQERLNFKCQLQKKKYEVIIDAQGLIKSAALVAHISQGEKHGLDYKSIREPLASYFYKHHHTVAKQQHAVERVRQLFASSLGYTLPSDSPGNYSIVNYFKLQLNHDPYLIFLHATTCAKKHWPENNWRSLIMLAHNAGYHIKLLWGSEDEYQRSYRLAKGYHQVEVLLPLSLEQIAEKLTGATAVVSVDTGMSHLAAALNCPNLTLYGPTDPNLIGTYGGSHQKILRAQNGHMKNLTAEYVWEILQTMIKK